MMRNLCRVRRQDCAQGTGKSAGKRREKRISGACGICEARGTRFEKKSSGAKWWIFGGVSVALAVAVLLVVILGGKGKLPAGLEEFVEKIEAGPGVEQTDGSEETAERMKGKNRAMNGQTALRK